MFNPEVGTEVPNVNMPVRVDGEFKLLNTKEQFAGKKVVLFGLPAHTLQPVRLTKYQAMIN